MTYFKRRESVRRDIERRNLDISEEVVKVIRVDHDLGQSFVSRALSQHCAAVECDVLVLVTARQESNNVYFYFIPLASPIKETHPDMSVKRISGLVHMYSTVGDLVPICLRRMLLKTCATSFFPLIRNRNIKFSKLLMICAVK